MDKQSILETAQGEILTRVDRDMEKIIENILDTRTGLKARELHVTLKFTPQKGRNIIKTDAETRIKLQPIDPVETICGIEADNNGELTIVEYLQQTPGQIDFDGNEAAAPKIIRMG